MFSDLSVRTQAFIKELLNALALIRLACVDVALRIHRDTAYSIELTGHASAVSEARHYVKGVPPQHEHLLVLTIGDVNEPLLWILRERNIPYRAVAERSLRYKAFLQELAVLLKHLDAI